MLDFFLSLLGTEEERSKFLALYDKHKERLHRVAMRFLHNNADAEDAVQEVFLQIAEGKTKIFDIPPNKQAAYLNILIRNISVKMYNKSMKITVTDPQGFYDKADLLKKINLEDTVISNISHEELVNFILSLSEGKRDAMVMKYILDLSNSEIVQHLGITENALRQRLFSARKAIKEFIEKGDHHE